MIKGWCDASALRRWSGQVECFTFPHPCSHGHLKIRSVMGARGLMGPPAQSGRTTIIIEMFQTPWAGGLLERARNQWPLPACGEFFGVDSHNTPSTTATLLRLNTIRDPIQ